MIFFRVDVYCLNICELRHLCRVRGSTGPRRCSLRSRRLEVVGARKNYFQAPGSGKIIKKDYSLGKFQQKWRREGGLRRRLRRAAKSLHPSGNNLTKSLSLFFFVWVIHFKLNNLKLRDVVKRVEKWTVFTLSLTPLWL